MINHLFITAIFKD